MQFFIHIVFHDAYEQVYDHSNDPVNGLGLIMVPGTSCLSEVSFKQARCNE